MDTRQQPSGYAVKALPAFFDLAVQRVFLFIWCISVENARCVEAFMDSGKVLTQPILTAYPCCAAQVTGC